MASSNHISYWNYLENVTANRNKEKLTAEGLGLQKELNTSQISVNEVQKLRSYAEMEKMKSEIARIEADAKSILENIDFTRRLTANKEAELKFFIEKTGKELGLKDRDIKNQENLYEAKRQELSLRKDIADLDRAFLEKKMWVETIGELVGLVGKAAGAATGRGGAITKLIK